MKENYVANFYVGDPANPEDMYLQLRGALFYAKGKPDEPGWRKLFKQQQEGTMVGDRKIKDEKDWTPLSHKGDIYPQWAIEVFDWYRENHPELFKRLKKEVGENTISKIPSLEEALK